MKKKIFLVILFMISLFFVGCATTKATEVFRFEVRELKLTISTVVESKEKELKLIRGEVDKNATVVYTVTLVEGDKAGQIDMNNGILQVIGTGTTEEGYVTTGINENVKILPLAEGVVKLNAFIKGKENVADSIVITVGRESLNGFKISAVKPEIVVGTTTGFKTSTSPSHIDASVLKYEVSDENIATISESGILTGIALGTVTVKAYSKYDPTMFSTTTVTISYAQAGKIRIFDANEDEIEDKLSMMNGDKCAITTLVSPKDTSLKDNSVSQKVTVTSDKTNVCSVETSETGYVLVAKSGGEAKIKITSEDKKAEETITVTVNWPQTNSFSVKVNDEEVSEEINGVVKKAIKFVRGAIDPENACPDFEIDFKDDGEEKLAEYQEILSIKGNEIEGLKPGTAYIVLKTIESKGNEPLTKEIKVNVSYDTIEAIEMVTKDITLITGDEEFENDVYETSIRWNLKPAGSNPGVTCTSDNETVATIDNEGNLVIKDSVGTAKITITSTDNPEVTATLVVKVADKPSSYTVDGPDDGASFVYSTDLKIELTVTILPAEAAQDLFEVEIDSSECEVKYTIDGSKITLTFDPESLGSFDVIITVQGVTGEWIHSYTVTAAND